MPVLLWSAGAISILMNLQAYGQAPLALGTNYPVQVGLTGSGKKSNPVSFMLTSGSPAGQ